MKIDATEASTTDASAIDGVTDVLLWVQAMIINPEKKVFDKVAEPPPAELGIEGAEAMWKLLAKAAEIAAKSGLAPDAFTAAAWQSYLSASPALAEQLAERQFEAALEELRNSGRMAKA